MYQDYLWREYPVVTLSDSTFHPGPWRLPTLFGTNANGRCQVWQIGYDGRCSYHTCFGLRDGKLRTECRLITLNSTGRTYPEQAFLECCRRYNDKKIEEGYREYGVEPVRNTKPMLANSYEPSNVTAFPIVVQPKLDGIRLLVTRTPEGISMRTRNGRPAMYMHLLEELTALFALLPPLVLDGELYVHEWPFERLTSAARTEMPTPDTLLLEYHVYDACVEGEYDARYQLLHNAFTRLPTLTRLRLVKTDFAQSHQDIENALQHYLSLRYEGIMLRRVPQSGERGTSYVCGRSNNLLKHKPFFDTEVNIVGVESAKGTEEGCAIFIVDWKGEEQLHVRPSATHEERRRWLQQPHLVVGKLATIRYNDTTNRGVPRFPRLHSIRDYE